jgi:hypothetical protein
MSIDMEYISASYGKRGESSRYILKGYPFLGTFLRQLLSVRWQILLL